MDVESKETIEAALNKLNGISADRIVDIQKVAVNVVDRLGTTIRGIVADLLADENHIIAALDGWTVEVAPITIRLRRPK